MLWKILPTPSSAQTASSDLRESISKPRRPPHPYLTVSLEAIYHHLPLGLVLPEIPEELLLGIIYLIPTHPEATKEALLLPTPGSLPC
jgi:hypothetical protein